MTVSVLIKIQDIQNNIGPSYMDNELTEDYTADRPDEIRRNLLKSEVNGLLRNLSIKLQNSKELM